jgi:hypothetical protein
MKSRILIPALFLLFVLQAGSLPVRASTITGELPTKAANFSMTKEQKEARFEAMKERVREIRAMDKSKLTKVERKALRTELRNMNKEAKGMGYYNGVYISVGALIIIILLLILILH